MTDEEIAVLGNKMQSCTVWKVFFELSELSRIHCLKQYLNNQVTSCPKSL